MTLGNINSCVQMIVECLESFEWRCATKQEIEENDGRCSRDSKISKTGSCVYIAYANDEVLYVGETSKSIKRRFISDGSGAHKHKPWFGEMTDIKFMIFEERQLPIMHRKLLEQVLSIKYQPSYYGGILNN